MILFVGMSSFSIITITILNILIIRTYDKFIARKLALRTETTRKNVPEIPKYQKGVTRVIIFSNVYFTSIRILHFLGVGLFMIQKIHGVYYHPFTNIFRGFAYSWMMVFYSSDFFIFMSYDKNLKTELKKIWTKRI